MEKQLGVEDALTRRIIGAAIEVHRVLGPGLLESVYEECLAKELGREGIAVLRQVQVPLVWRGEELAQGLRLDMLVEGEVVVEVKAIEAVLAVHKA
jgi:GxxExxY protein